MIFSALGIPADNQRHRYDKQDPDTENISIEQWDAQHHARQIKKRDEGIVEEPIAQQKQSDESFGPSAAACHDNTPIDSLNVEPVLVPRSAYKFAIVSWVVFCYFFKRITFFPPSIVQMK